MANHLIQGSLIMQDENLDVHLKKTGVDGKTKSSKLGNRKGGAGFGNRKALNDITNKSSFHHEASSRKKNLPKQEFNIAEEMFLHDHKKCMEAQRASVEPCFWDTVLPGSDAVSSAELSEHQPEKTHPDSPRCYPEPVELSMSEFSDWLKLSTQWDSPPASPLYCDPPLPSTFAWEFQPVEFFLKQEDI